MGLKGCRGAETCGTAIVKAATTVHGGDKIPEMAGSCGRVVHGAAKMGRVDVCITAQDDV